MTTLVWESVATRFGDKNVLSGAVEPTTALGEGWEWWQGWSFLKAGGRGRLHGPGHLFLEKGQLTARLKTQSYWPGAEPGGRPAVTQ